MNISRYMSNRAIVATLRAALRDAMNVEVADGTTALERHGCLQAVRDCTAELWRRSELQLSKYSESSDGEHND